MHMRYAQGQNEEYLYTIQEYVLNHVLTILEYILNQVLPIRVGLCTCGIHSDRMRSTYYPGVCTKPGTH